MNAVFGCCGIFRRIPLSGTLEIENMSREADIIESVVRACRLWQTFNHAEEVLRLGEFVERIGAVIDCAYSGTRR